MIYLFKNSNHGLIVPNRCGSRYLDSIVDKYSTSFSRIYNRDNSPNTWNDDCLEVSALHSLPQTHIGMLELYIPIRDPVAQYCSALALHSTSKGQLSTCDNRVYNKDFSELDSFTFGYAYLYGYFKALKMHKVNRTDGSIYHFGNKSHYRPPVLIPFYLTLGGWDVRTLSLKDDELTNFIEEKIPELKTNNIHKQHNTGFEHRDGKPNDIGAAYYEWMQFYSPNFNAWINIWIDLYNNFVKDMNSRSKLENYSCAVDLYHTLINSEKFKKIDPAEYNLMLAYNELYFRIPGVQ